MSRWRGSKYYSDEICFTTDTHLLVSDGGSGLYCTDCGMHFNEEESDNIRLFMKHHHIPGGSRVTRKSFEAALVPFWNKTRTTTENTEK